MKNINLFTILLMFLWPSGLKADDQQPDANVNERYLVESVDFFGIDPSKVSASLRDEAQKMVGERYSEQSANGIARNLRKELQGYRVEIKVEKGDQPERVKIVFEMKRRLGNSVGATPLVVYQSKEGFSGRLEIPAQFNHNIFTFGLLSDADQLLERYAGLQLRYERTKLGTSMLRLRMDFDSYHEKFNPATETALAQNPDIPGIYRSRQNFAPSLSISPNKEISISGGVSFQRLQFQYPAIHTLAAYAGTADIRYRRSFQSTAGYDQEFSAAYSLRTATRILASDLVYTRHFFSVDYTLSRGKNLMSAHFIAGHLTGTAPLFERFSLGNSFTLRGWNKFDVAPLGGNRTAHGSLEYRYGHLQVFYDAGTVWNSKTFSQVRHGLGFGWASKHLFASLAFPVRLHNVSPVFIMGIR